MAVDVADSRGLVAVSVGSQLKHMRQVNLGKRGVEEEGKRMEEGGEGLRKEGGGRGERKGWLRGGVEGEGWCH